MDGERHERAMIVSARRSPGSDRHATRSRATIARPGETLEMKTLIKNGTIVTATDTYGVKSDRRRQDLADRRELDAAGRQVDRREGQVRAARRHRRAHAPRHAIRRIVLRRRFQDGHDRRGARRHDVHRRLRDPGARPLLARSVGDVDGEGRGQSGLDFGFHDHARVDERLRRWGTWSRGRHFSKLFMAYQASSHGRRLDLPHDAALRRNRQRSACTRERSVIDVLIETAPSHKAPKWRR